MAAATTTNSREPEQPQEQEWKKYSEYELDVDPDQGDRAKQLRFINCRVREGRPRVFLGRPHMRAFHGAWIALFVATYMWHALSPLVADIRVDLGITKYDVWDSSRVGGYGTILACIMVGPLCDIFEARRVMAYTVCLTAMVACYAGFVNDAGGLVALRFFLGMAGSVFVMAQFWMGRMFAKEVIGTTAGIVAGLGHFPAAMFAFSDRQEDYRTGSWRYAMISPALRAFAVVILIHFFSDDTPKGNCKELEEHGVSRNGHAARPTATTGIAARLLGKFSQLAASFRCGCMNANTWLLFLQYACCYGVELTMINAASLHLVMNIGEPMETARDMATLPPFWSNLFLSRALGGFLSDTIHARMGGMQGRLVFQSILLAVIGILVLVFVNTNDVEDALTIYLLFILFVQACSGAILAVVLHVDHENDDNEGNDDDDPGVANAGSTGTVVGLVRAGGHLGALGFGRCFREFESLNAAFCMMGSLTLLSSLLSLLIYIQGHQSASLASLLQSWIRNNSE